VKAALDQDPQGGGGLAAAGGVALRRLQAEQPDGDLAAVEVQLEAVAVDDADRATVVERPAACRRRPARSSDLGLNGPGREPWQEQQQQPCANQRDAQMKGSDRQRCPVLVKK
jgi:hypothetical protein